MISHVVYKKVKLREAQSERVATRGWEVDVSLVNPQRICKLSFLDLLHSLKKILPVSCLDNISLITNIPWPGREDWNS